MRLKNKVAVITGAGSGMGRAMTKLFTQEDAKIIAADISSANKFGFERSISGVGSNPGNGKPEEIAKVALFLATDEASFVNAATVTVDGGRTAY